MRLFVTLFLFHWAESGHILFFSPFCSKSSLITLPTLSNTLIENGHQVTVVTSWALKDFHPNVTQITVDSGFSNINEKFSESILGNASLTDIAEVYQLLISKAVDTAERAITHPKLHLKGNQSLKSFSFSFLFLLKNYQIHQCRKSRNSVKIRKFSFLLNHLLSLPKGKLRNFTKKSPGNPTISMKNIVEYCKLKMKYLEAKSLVSNK